MRLLLLGADDIVRALPMTEAIDAMGSAFAALSAGESVIAPARQVLEFPDRAVNLVMPAYQRDIGLTTKVASVFPGNHGTSTPTIQSAVLMQDPSTGEIIAVLDGTFLTSWRTAAAAGLATKLLAPSEAQQAAVIGAGGQARAQIIALDCVLDLEVVRIFSRTRDKAEQLAADLDGSVATRLEVVATAAAAVRTADVITTVTNSATPVLDSPLVPRGCHINALGSYTASMCELDSELVGRSHVFIDYLESALDEAGELIAAENEGLTHRSEWTEIGWVAEGSAPGRRSAGEITLFKSVGHAVQDLYAASAVVTKAVEDGLVDFVQF